MRPGQTIHPHDNSLFFTAMSYGCMASLWVDDVAKSKHGEHLLGGGRLFRSSLNSLRLRPLFVFVLLLVARKGVDAVVDVVKGEKHRKYPVYSWREIVLSQGVRPECRSYAEAPIDGNQPDRDGPEYC
jgi:hypothetical protein